MWFKPRVKSWIFANLRVGRADISPSKPSHVRGVREGNKPHGLEHEPGFEEETATTVLANARRSTGIGAKARNPIDPDMPKLSPA